jgi:nucleoside-diphosphate-sugar epimerase
MSQPPRKILVLGGTAWLGRQLCHEAVGRGHVVWCLARGESGPAAEGARLVRANRRTAGAYDTVRERDWDAVIDLSWQPGLVRSALVAFSERAAQWIYVSSASVYASHAVPGADERSELLEPTELDEVEVDLYGPAKVACERACHDGHPSVLIARAGLIGGPGDVSDRAGYWVARAARDPATAMLVPDSPEAMTQVIDFRDLAAWLIDCAEQGTVGTYDAVGEVIALAEWIEVSRSVGGHSGAVVAADGAWLLAHGVEEFMGPEALALWIADPDWRGFGARSGYAAARAGLIRRPVRETLADTLSWERAQGLSRVRSSGISAEREAELLAMLR